MKNGRLNMKDCCSHSDCKNTSLKKYSCPVNLIDYPEVSVQTIIHHINEPWRWKQEAEHYYFCNDPSCYVAYFGDNGDIITKAQLRSHSGQELSPQSDLLCYCFGITASDVTNQPDIRNFVVKQTRNGICSCKTRNPSGRCCLKDFPKPE